MSNPKRKSENFQNLGGINSKASPYLTGPMEFLDLSNLDFQFIGALSQRWGSTMYVGQTFPGPINSLFEYAKLDGSSYVVSSYSGGIYYGATTGNSQGMSLTNINATLSFTTLYPVTSPAFIGGQFMYQVVTAYGSAFKGPQSSQLYGAGETFVLNPQVQSENILSCAILNNYLFMADGSKFVKFDGTTTTPVGLPPVLWGGGFAGGASAFGMSLSTRDGATFGFSVGSTFGVYYLWTSYVNNRGFEGPLFPLVAIDAQLNGWSPGASTGSGPVSVGSTLLNINIPIATPLGLGLSAINVYTYYDPTTGATVGNYHDLQAEATAGWLAGTPVFLNSFPASGSTLTVIQPGAPQGASITSNIGRLPSTDTLAYMPLGMTLGSFYSRNLGSSLGTNALTSYYPRFIETYQNRLFLAGFSATPSLVWFSALGEPEGYKPEFNFEVRTNDGDFITAIKAYSTRFHAFKKSSFHVLSGDNPQNFYLQEISHEYGCLNNRCVTIFEETLLFLDRKGMITWNGAATSVLSAKIQPTFDRMNYSAALTEACMVHDKLRNQILVAIPIDGSSINNITIVYDYLVGSLTTHRGYSAKSFAAIQGRNNTKNVFYGSYSGTINWFGASFLTDNGVGFTTYLKSRFLHDQGETTQKMFRRLFLNIDSPASSTLVLGINFYKNYGSTAIGKTMVMSQFQNRISFGIQGKSLAFEMTNMQTTIPLRIHGFTVESRYLRGV